MIKAGIIGATGYTGAELIRLLSNHPNVNLVAIGAREERGAIDLYHKNMYQCLENIFCDIDIKNFSECDIVFLALPHGASSHYVRILLENNIKIIDLGADFRLNDIQNYHKWYGTVHECPEMLVSTVYGLPEINKEIIKDELLIANPGCFPTSIILGLAPVCVNKLLDESHIVVDSVSGLSGAGKKLSESSHFVNVNNNVTAYGVGNHRHLPEIIQEIEALCEKKVDVIFTPHLVPLNRGILSTITFKVCKDITQEELECLYKEFYEQKSFVRIRINQYADIKSVVGSNYCDISLNVLRNRTVVITSAIDNLVKGASGQAIQNMNIMFGLNEDTGLNTIPMWP